MPLLALASISTNRVSLLFIAWDFLLTHLPPLTKSMQLGALLLSLNFIDPSFLVEHLTGPSTLLSKLLVYKSFLIAIG